MAEPPALVAAATVQPGRLSVDERREIVEVFFLAHPGPGQRGLGLGRAVADFVEWEASSGRLDEPGGSPWWRAVNESFVLDLRAASAGAAATAATAEASAAWNAYLTAGADAQRALWTAHQVSLTGAVQAAAPLLGGELPAEQAFAEIVLAVVARTAADCVPTDTTALARSTRRLYPAGYPISAAQLEVLAAKLGRLPASVTGHEGTR
jgi:hypothetical protein